MSSTSSAWLARVPIRTERLTLRCFEDDDWQHVHRYASDPEVTRYLSWGPNTPDETRAFVRGAAERGRVRDAVDVDLAIVDALAGDVIGGCGLISRRAQYREFELGYCLARGAWGRGIATEAVRALVELGFEHMRAHRIYALVDPDNPASGRVLEKVGFRQEGRFRRDSLMGGAWRDSLVYAMLSDDERQMPDAARPT